jgi:hypothetical protein
MVAGMGGREEAVGTRTADKRDGAARERLAAAIAGIDAVLPGTVVVRHMACGKAVCRCKADPPSLHGPYIQWTRTVGGKTVSRYLTKEQLEAYKPWFDNAKRLRKLLGELEAISVGEVEAALKSGGR